MCLKNLSVKISIPCSRGRSMGDPLRAPRGRARNSRTDRNVTDTANDYAMSSAFCTDLFALVGPRRVGLYSVSMFYLLYSHQERPIPCRLQPRFTNICASSPPNWANEFCKTTRAAKARRSSVAPTKDSSSQTVSGQAVAAMAVAKKVGEGTQCRGDRGMWHGQDVNIAGGAACSQ